MPLFNPAQSLTGAAGTLFDDFLNPPSTSVYAGPLTLLASTATGTLSGVAPPDASAFGVFQLSTAAGTTGRAGLFTGLNDFRFGGGAYTLTWRFQFPTALLDGTEQGAVYVGFIDLQTAAPADGAYLYWDNAQTNFRYRTRSNSVETDVNSGLAPAIDTWYKLVITVNAAGSSVNFTINGANSQDLTTNIPTAAGRETGIGANIIKSAGTNPRLVNLDYVKLDWQMTGRA